jgi:eukaryotic-like serine/threonine-protein kinase
MPVPSNTRDFLEVVEQSKLVDPDRLQAYMDDLTSHGFYPADPIECAQVLVCDGLITNFQAHWLLRGKWQGFFIDDKYRILDYLGLGGMGSVYLCEHRVMKRRVAIKILPLHGEDSTPQHERFCTEARALCRLNHHNILRAYDLDGDREHLYLILEWVRSINFKQLVDHRGKLPYPSAVNLIIQTCSALQHMHESQMVHRDITPRNLLIDQIGVVKMLDLGLVRFLKKNRQSDSYFGDNLRGIHGSPDYIAPEQIDNADTVDIRADIYSLGATFYYLLAGHAPFPGGTTVDKLMAHQNREPTRIDELRADVPIEIARIIHKMLAKNADERYATPLAVANDLRRWNQFAFPTTDPSMVSCVHELTRTLGAASDAPPLAFHSSAEINLDPVLVD